MTKINTGWDLVTDQGSFDGEKQEVEFLKVPIGDTKVRVLEEAPFAYEEYWSNKGNGGKGTSVPYVKGCLLEKENKEYLDRELAKARKIKDPKKRKDAMRKVYQGQPWKRRMKFAINVIDRADGQVKILDKGLAVFRELKKFQDNPEYGDLRNYDITITRTGEGLNTEYSVVPARQNTDLTEEELALELFDMEEYRDFSHMTPEQVYQIAKGATWEEVLESNDVEDEDIEIDEEDEDVILDDSNDEAVEDDGQEDEIDIDDITFE